ncbi:alkaline shock response membrane anchor protein AmaP [Streptomyces sp. JH002]|uniref:Membrane protein n=1 Tax=Streptomyces xiamenensis TaxID=408015 RepID=A0A0F7CN31_9ACTN|nr:MULTISPECIES: alkaline shock response membrane anchor protein AmaP [Streptomyces]AKG42201.1 membrane protein [Streptomyces xiamenensis]
MLRITNRILLALTGLGLLTVGLAVLFAALDLPGRWGITLPSGYTWRGPGNVLLGADGRTRWHEAGWFWPVVLGLLGLLVLLALWWLLAQLRRRRLSEILVDSEDGVGALLRGQAMEEVVRAEAESLPGIDHATVTLTGRRTEPRARVGLLLSPQAEPADVVRRLEAEALAHAGRSAGLESLPTEVRLRAAKHPPERVS